VLGNYSALFLGIQGVWSVAISPDGQTVVSGSYDGTIKLWRLGTGELLRTISGHPQGVWSVAISPNGHIARVAVKTRQLRFGVWTLGNSSTISGHSDSVRAAISSDGQTLASGWDKTIKIWNLHNGELLRTLSGHTSQLFPSPSALIGRPLLVAVRIRQLKFGV